MCVTGNVSSRKFHLQEGLPTPRITVRNLYYPTLTDLALVEAPAQSLGTARVTPWAAVRRLVLGDVVLEGIPPRDLVPIHGVNVAQPCNTARVGYYYLRVK